MPGVDPKIICHRLAVDPTHKPVKQKKRFLSVERREFVTKQVTTLQFIGHIREVRYPEWEEEGAQRPVYYVARVLRGAELRYTNMEKTIFAVKKLTPYFQAHPVHVLSQIPIGTLLRSPNAPSRVSKWGVFLGSFQIEFKPRPAIKGQTLADFVVECTAREVESSGEEPEGNWWTVYTDGSSATDASGGGVVAISPEGFKAYYAVRFRFKVSNNEAEYEALLCGLRLVASLKAERIQVRCDSKLVVGHVTGEFEAKDERMKKYRDTALELLKAFGANRIEQVPREENAEADILSKLGPDSPDHIKAMTQEEELLKPSISPGQVLIITLREEPDWIDEITMYILDGSLPIDPIAAKGMEGAWSIPVNPPVRQAVGGEGLVRLIKVFIRVWRWRRRFHRRPLPARQTATEFVRVKPPQSLELTDLGEEAGSGEEGAGPSERSRETGIPSDMARMEKRGIFGDGAE
ncbi:unnamed protein product [Cuscuta campestris]|uniref:RNase H type-1 domain-containing protein n=1 Tax=Cuscuta campestris TaxID=132261 RepID=A0A484LLD2_9ASTE|nr:unnamed protein product [Cuscuta campestris]